MNSADFTHLDEQGNARMVDVSGKKSTLRTAIAAGEVRLQQSTLGLIRAGRVDKGDVLSTARLAGIMAAKRTSEMIPLCHQVRLNQVNVQFELSDDLPGVLIHAEVTAEDRTGVEMEALSAVSLAALTIYDMIKAVEHGARIHNIRLVRKSGGRSGVLEFE